MSSEKYNSALELANLAKNLNKIKKSKKFGNFKKMALRLNIGHQHLSDIVSKRKEPSDRLIEDMARVFNVPREKLLSHEEFSITAENDPNWSSDPMRRDLIEKVKRFVQIADDQAVTAMLNNVDEFQKGADARLEIKKLRKGGKGVTASKLNNNRQIPNVPDYDIHDGGKALGVSKITDAKAAPKAATPADRAIPSGRVKKRRK